MQVTTVTTEGNYKYNPHISPFPLIGLYSKQVYWVYIKGGIILYVILPNYYIRKNKWSHVYSVIQGSSGY